MDLCHSYQHRVMPLRATRKYDWTEVRSMCQRVTGPFWLRVEGQLIPIQGEESLDLACQVSAAYHDWVAYNAPDHDEEGLPEDTQQPETADIACE